MDVANSAPNYRYNTQISCNDLFRLFSVISAAEHDVLSVIKIPFEDQKTMYFDSGADGFPAYGLRPGSDVKAPYRLTFPEILYSAFALVGTVKMNTEQGGFVFAVVNPLETVSPDWKR